MQNKLIGPEDQDLGVAHTVLIKHAAEGLRGDDLKRFGKRASPELVTYLKGFKPHKDEHLAHSIVMGSTEWYGANRNADGFKEAICKARHHTFVKHAKPYRNHTNSREKNRKRTGRDEDPPYFGRIIKSAYHPDMHWTELVIGYNGSKEAAQANGGEIADKEIEKLLSGKPLALSMSCAVSGDFCSSCRHFAKDADHQCDEFICNRGGLKRNKGRITKDGHHMHMDNDDPMLIFFDATHVESNRPADRIAWTMRVLRNDAANHKHAESVLRPADTLYLPKTFVESLSKNEEAIRDQIIKLASIERRHADDRHREADAFYPIARRFDVPRLERNVNELRSLMKAAADEGLMLTPEELFGAVAKHAGDDSEIRRHLPGAFTRLAARRDLDEMIADNPFTEDRTATLEHREWAKKHAEHSLSSLRRRVIKQASESKSLPVRQVLPMIKEASEDNSAAQLAEMYALYQATFLKTFSEKNSTSQDFCYFAIRSNSLA